MLFVLCRFTSRTSSIVCSLASSGLSASTIPAVLPRVMPGSEFTRQRTGSRRDSCVIPTARCSSARKRLKRTSDSTSRGFYVAIDFRGERLVCSRAARRRYIFTARQCRAQSAVLAIVNPSVCHTLALCQNKLCYNHAVFSHWRIVP